MSEHKLKPCPFCGGKAKTWVQRLGNVGVCGCVDEDRTCPIAPCIGFSLSDNVERANVERARAINRWNSRADLPPTPAEAMRCPEVMALVEALRPFAEAAMHLHPAIQNDATTLDGIEAGQWRAAYAALAALEQAVRHE